MTYNALEVPKSDCGSGREIMHMPWYLATSMHKRSETGQRQIRPPATSGLGKETVMRLHSQTRKPEARLSESNFVEKVDNMRFVLFNDADLLRKIFMIRQ